MPVQDEKKGEIILTISSNVHQKIASLRRGNQTYEDVIAASIAALERELEFSDIPCIDDIDMDELDKKVDEWNKEPEKYYITLEESEIRYKRNRKIL